MKIIETHSAGETFELGRQIGQQAAAGEVYTLTGDLGVGKTVLTQGVAAGLGIDEPVCSPLLPLSRFMKRADCPFTILMCTASVMWRRWMRSAMRIISTAMVSA